MTTLKEDILKIMKYGKEYTAQELRTELKNTATKKQVNANLYSMRQDGTLRFVQSMGQSRPKWSKPFPTYEEGDTVSMTPYNSPKESKHKRSLDSVYLIDLIHFDQDSERRFLKQYNPDLAWLVINGPEVRYPFSQMKSEYYGFFVSNSKQMTKIIYEQAEKYPNIILVTHRDNPIVQFVDVETLLV